MDLNPPFTTAARLPLRSVRLIDYLDPCIRWTLAPPLPLPYSLTLSLTPLTTANPTSEFTPIGSCL